MIAFHRSESCGDRIQPRGPTMVAAWTRAVIQVTNISGVCEIPSRDKIHYQLIVRAMH